MNAIVLAAGKGTRMKSGKPKVLHEAFGKSLLSYVLSTLSAAKISEPYVVLGYQADAIKATLGKQVKVVLQKEQKGTGHAVLMTQRALAATREDVLIWPGDMPLLEGKTLQKFIKKHRAAKSVASVLSCVHSEPQGYGRILRNSTGDFLAIREELDASPREKSITEVNTGVYIFSPKFLFPALKKIGKKNKKGEYYLTDTMAYLKEQGQQVCAFDLADAEEGFGVNSQMDLSKVTKIINRREIEKHLKKGVTIVDPDQTYIAPNVKIGAGTVIHPCTYIETQVVIGKNCEVGPFAKIRAHSKMGDASVVGSFVEVNRSTLGKRVAAKHLTYLGDAVVADDVNIGAGTITANYDGKKKHKTEIGKQAKIGSNTVLVAPLKIAEKVTTGAGSVVTKKTKMKKGDTVLGVPAKAKG